MIRKLFALLLTLAAVLLGTLWLARDLEPDALPAALPRLHTVDLDDLVDSALESAPPPAPAPPPPAAAAPAAPAPAPPAPPALAEESLPEPEPFAEALPAEWEAAGPGEETAEPEPASLEAGARDQDASAELIRRMLELQRRAAAR